MSLPSYQSGSSTDPESYPRMVGRRTLADRLDLSLATLDRLNASGKLPQPIKLGGRILWDIAEIAAWVASRCPARAKWDPIWREMSPMSTAAASIDCQASAKGGL